MRANILTVSEPVSIALCCKFGSFWLKISAFIIHPQNASGRTDNITWNAEYTLIVSDWLVHPSEQKIFLG